MAKLLFNDPAPWNYTVIAGTSNADGVWTFEDEDGPIDLSGFTEIRASWRLSYGSTESAFDMSTDDGSIVNGGVAGTVEFIHDTDATAALSESRGFAKTSYYMDVEGVHANGVDAIFRGKVLLDPSACRTGDGS